ncbi:molecular chaperone EcpD [Frateuria sp. Soil773]|uniref:fimbrial biogenesis chaperone n=1 Tax=Frateuria sp. Soil773 TaxID=1736407 RepID=UPI0006FA7189|nr:fimbria/pilus periplasmic chaperone [Frateuria sp. Soil773]KRE96629.1 molecular chaperone EcpD [Frateuria sp. Soil773]
MKKLVRALGAGLMAFGLGLATAHATVVIGGTRVVFSGADSETTLRLSNEGNQPALVQAWIDHGDPQSTPDKVDVPFLLTPPLFRMDAHKGQSLRIVYTHEALPADRESLFWLNVLEVPPKPTDPESEGKNLLQLAIRSRLKLFYRPANLPGDPLKAPAQVGWKLVADGQGRALEARNPSPYFITLNAVTLDVAGKAYKADTGMIEPFGTLKLAVPGLAQATAGATVTFGAINDYGAASEFKGTVSP